MVPFRSRSKRQVEITTKIPSLPRYSQTPVPGEASLTKELTDCAPPHCIIPHPSLPGPSGNNQSNSPFPPQEHPSLGQPIAHEGVDAVAGGAEAAQLDALAAGDLLGVAVAPLDGHVAVGVGVDEHVEGAVAAQLRQERHARRDLPEDGRDLRLYLCFGLGLCRARWGGAAAAGAVVAAVGVGFFFEGEGGSSGRGGGWTHPGETFSWSADLEALLLLEGLLKI